MAGILGAVGGIASGLFGGSSKKETSESGNKAYSSLNTALMPAVNNGVGASNSLAQMLGMGGSASQNEGFANYRKNGGYDFLMNEGIRGITGNAASRGLLRSGSTLKGISKYSSGLASTYLDNYLKNLLGLGQLGTANAGILSDAGKYSTGSASGSSNDGGLGKFLGSLLGGIAK